MIVCQNSGNDEYVHTGYDHQHLSYGAGYPHVHRGWSTWVLAMDFCEGGPDRQHRISMRHKWFEPWGNRETGRFFPSTFAWKNLPFDVHDLIVHRHQGDLCELASSALHPLVTEGDQARDLRGTGPIFCAFGRNAESSRPAEFRDPTFAKERAR